MSATRIAFTPPASAETSTVGRAEPEQCLSELVNEAVRIALAEDAEDLAAFEERAAEPSLRFDAVVRGLKQRGRI